MDNFQNIQKLAKLLQGTQLITTEELSGLVTDIVNAFAQYRAASKELNQEQKDTLNLALRQLNGEHSRILSLLETNKTDTSKEVKDSIAKMMADCQSMCDEVMAMKPQDGKDADEEKIIQEVLSKIEIPENKITAEAIRDNLETLEGEERLDVSAIKGIEDFVKGLKLSKVTGWGARMLSTLFDVSIVSPTDGQVLTYDGTNNRWYNADGGGSGVSVETPTGAINGSNTNYTVANPPLFVISDGVTYFEGNGFTYSAGALTMDYAPTGFLVSVYGSSSVSNGRDSSTAGTIVGTIDGVNLIFTLSHAPLTNTLQLFYEGQCLEENLDYTLSGSTITFVVAAVPEAGSILQAFYQY